MAEAKKPSKKEELLAEAKKLKLSVTAKNTIAQIEEAIAEAKAAKESTAKVAELVETEAIAEAIVEAEAEIDAEEQHVTKAGKHSAKGLKEAEEKAAKEDRKAHASEAKAEEAAKPKPAIKTRSRLERQGKKFRAAAELIDKSKEYSLAEALELAVKTNPAKFDATVELHIKLNVDPRHADQNIRANLVLPAGTGKSVTVAVFAEADDVATAKKAGADIAGNEDFMQQLDKNIIDFDVLIATPAMMPKLGKYARVLGPKGLMPSPKSGTVTTDVTKAVNEAKAGRVEYRVDSTGIVHLGIGKVSFGAAKLNDNAKAVLGSIRGAKPASIKGSYVQSVFVTTSMGPGIKVASSEV
jgi:large subunit ribosomal protein L1